MNRKAYVQLEINGCKYDFFLNPACKKSIINSEAANVMVNYRRHKKDSIHFDSIKCGSYDFNDITS